MEFLHASIALLASMVLVLAGLVGWLYWQQTRIFQNMNNIVMVIGEIVRPRQEPVEEEPAEEKPVEAPAGVQEAPVEEDDRASVDVVETAPAEVDTDDLADKTKKELQDILTKKGIPFSKSDAKPALLSLLKATA
jgi:predicted negative regulator of RcsB-dependent stress response